ncbi:MAG: CBS domain-containing protein [Planctomycetales bacterium]
MTPRVAVVCVRDDDTVADVKQKIADCQHSRIPVVGERIDEVKGVLLKGDLLRLLLDARNENDPVGQHMEEAIFVQENVRADVLLEIFKSSRMHLAVVLDEFAGMAGVVSLEDVLEVLTGEIMDEYDHAPVLQEEARKKGREKLKECAEVKEE